MVNANYIRTGRLVRVLRGPRQDKVGIIVDIVDGNRVLIENPQDKKMWRHVASVKNLEPLKFAIDIPRNCSAKKLSEELAKKDIIAKYGATKKAQKIVATQALANSTDFERYQLRVAKRSRAFWTRKVFDENDKKSPVSWHKVLLKKLQKNAAKIDGKPANKKRIEKVRAARKAKPASKKVAAK